MGKTLALVFVFVNETDRNATFLKKLFQTKGNLKTNPSRQLSLTNWKQNKGKHEEG